VRPYLKNPSQKIGLVEWLKVKALSSSPSTGKEKKKASGMAAITYAFLYHLLSKGPVDFKGKEVIICS
jgi:hypothetical protein